MGKLSISEVIIYLLIFGAIPLLMPFFYFILLSIILSPLLLMEMISTLSKNVSYVANLLFPGLRFLTAVGIFGLYAWIIKKIAGTFGGIRMPLFLIIFVISSILNYLFSFSICAISVLKPCDVTRLFTLAGVIEIYDFYVICLLAVIAVKAYLHLKLSGFSFARWG